MPVCYFLLFFVVVIFVMIVMMHVLFSFSIIIVFVPLLVRLRLTSMTGLDLRVGSYNPTPRPPCL